MLLLCKLVIAVILPKMNVGGKIKIILLYYILFSFHLAGAFLILSNCALRPSYNSPADGEVAAHLKWVVFHSHNRLRQLSTQGLLLNKLEVFFFTG
jgi:hypothetical protein